MVPDAEPLLDQNGHTLPCPQLAPKAMRFGTLTEPPQDLRLLLC
jgi:hypothetical protein